MRLLFESLSLISTRERKSTHAVDLNRSAQGDEVECGDPRRIGSSAALLGLAATHRRFSKISRSHRAIFLIRVAYGPWECSKEWTSASWDDFPRPAPDAASDQMELSARQAGHDLYVILYIPTLAQCPYSLISATCISARSSSSFQKLEHTRCCGRARGN